MIFVLLQETTAPPELRWGGEGNFRSIRSERALETELQSELNEAGVVHRAVHRSKTLGVDIVDRQAELRVVKQVEELKAERTA